MNQAPDQKSGGFFRYTRIADGRSRRAGRRAAMQHVDILVSSNRKTRSRISVYAHSFKTGTFTRKKPPAVRPGDILYAIAVRSSVSLILEISFLLTLRKNIKAMVMENTSAMGKDAHTRLSLPAAKPMRARI